MRLAILIPACLTVLSACVIAPSTTELAAPPEPVLTRVTEARLAFIAITGTLPEAGNDMPPGLLDGLSDTLPVRLDLTLQPPLAPAVESADGSYGPLPDCAFGAQPAREISVPTGSNHMLLSVRMGTPEDHPANLFSCEYDPGLQTDEAPGISYRLRGCFLPQSVSIPTAVLWVLNPLPATACGIGD
ncbi:MAG: hypothetical protein ACO33A_01680 [Hyphomonas sp.]